jgi:hypothetical protein
MSFWYRFESPHLEHGMVIYACQSSKPRRANLFAHILPAIEEVNLEHRFF